MISTTTEPVAARGSGLRTILIVDDDTTFSTTLADGLATVNPRLAAYTAGNGREATAIINTMDIDLVITDLRMPAMGGLELTMWINELWPQIPVIVLSAYADAGTVLDLATQGNYFFDKPVDFSGLVRAVESLVH